MPSNAQFKSTITITTDEFGDTWHEEYDRIMHTLNSSYFMQILNSPYFMHSLNSSYSQSDNWHCNITTNREARLEDSIRDEEVYDDGEDCWKP